MTKETKEALEKTCARICELKNIKTEAEKELKTLEEEVKSAMNSAGETDCIFGSYAAKLIHVSGGFSVDTTALKADGLYDKYKKPRADYDKLAIIDGSEKPDNA